MEARPPKEGRKVVKGTSKRVVVVKSPDPTVFEQAIFIVREDFIGRTGRANALKEAQQVADEYIRSAVATPRDRIFSRIPPALWAAAGAVLAGGIGMLIYFL
ncbi:MAG: translation initiation factor 2 [Ruminococcaceae bacterium]|nr:translation initiation factor 2 [Oscillospiraceae bacterium]